LFLLADFQVFLESGTILQDRLFCP
jgi:hypothetical protein